MCRVEAPTESGISMNKSIVSPTFTITYARNCDGGMQEMATAVRCIRDIYPESSVRTIRVDRPLRVTIEAEFESRSAGSGGGNNADNTGLQQRQAVWTCHQQNLFERNPKRRKRAMASIRTTLATLKEHQLLEVEANSSSSVRSNRTLESCDTAIETINSNENETVSADAPALAM